ncbi:TonB-dependent receptor domain-containing protein [Sphingomonas kyeonggiensis]|uniref:Outer membrane receptor protein involved in Fe transport n=1 Tax=Sphingomonas kyeonggiensis TaxID=1268553 RepID=A0A7W6JXM3_9SPHN|nr:TonB-dependent receptor [Sphingomonas kyeonggiensis]MBB4100441.1 outer membrane receptor protein involved in Fe transport [Sphingomonas kyeonggiensis]
MKLSTILLAATFLSTAAPAFGQTADVPPADQAGAQDENGNEILVTGSRIRRQDIAGVGPATVVSAEQIENTGIVNVETLLQRLPANAGFAGNQSSAYWTGNGYGTAQVNLRGLGIKRTLVLLNNRRLVAGGTGANSSPDLNMIPVAALARTDVLKDGASAIYGADAMAGVVNLVTRTDFNGIGISARSGITERGDGGDYTVDLLLGKRGSRGGILIAATYQKTEPVNMASRAPCSLAETTPGSLSCVNSASTIGGRAALPNGQQINFNQVPGGNGNFYEPYSAAKHNFNSNPFLYAVSPIERITTAVFGDYDLSDRVELFGEFLYTRRNSNQIATPGTLRNLAISASNPTNPTGQNLVLIQRRLAEPGPREFFQRTNTWQGTLGLRGKLANDWAWEVAGAYGRNTAVDGSTNIANLQRVANSLDTTKCSFAASAAIPCADYLGFGDLTPKVLDYILFTSRDRGGNSLLSVTGDLNGSLFRLPAGAVSFATGVSYREEKGWRNPDPLTVAGIANTNQQSPISGRTRAKEAYLELSVPVLANTPFFRALTLDGAVRYSSYDLFGDDWNYKLSADWMIVDGVRLRGTYGTGFRVPNVPELFGGVSEGNLTTTDPCSRYSASTNATLVANCRASGVPAGYVQLGTTILTTVGGNQNLKAETSKSWTLGTVLQPKGIVPGLSLTADWFDIDITGAIRAIPGSTKLSGCYASANLSHPFCKDFTRSALTGEVTYLSAQPINTGREQMSGLDLGLVYAHKLGRLGLQVDLNATYLDRYVVEPFPGGAPIIFDGRIGGGNGGYPKWRGYGVATASQDGVSFTWSTQWIGKAQDFNAAPTAIGYRAPAIFYHNAQLAFEVTAKTRFQIGVDNLFDTKAPYIASFTDGNTDTMTYDLLGRRFYVGFRTAF